MTPQHRQHYYHHHRHHHRMEIVLENLSVAPLPTRTPASPSAGTSQLGLPMNSSAPVSPPPPPPPLPSSSSSSSSSHHFAHRKTLYDVDVSPLLPADDYYARGRHELTSYDRDVDGASSGPLTVRRIGKSGLLEIAETDTTVCPRSRVFTGAEDVTAVRTAASLRFDRSVLLEAVPEAVDQLEDECNSGVSSEHDTVTTTTNTLDNEESSETTPRGESFKIDADVNPCVFDGVCRSLEQPSSLEGLASSCPSEVATRSHSADVQVSSGSPRTQFDVSTKATERLPHLSSFSPGPSLRRPRNDPSRGPSLLTSHCTDADSFAARLRNQRSPEFPAKYTAANPGPMSLHGTLTSSSFTATASPIMRGQPQMRCSKESLEHPASFESAVDVLSADPIKPSRDSLLAKGSTGQGNDAMPGEERAEAEGCEHTAVEGLEEDEVSFKGSNKLLDNDNVQTLRVIILSEQL